MKQKGFTLIELLVTMGIIAVLSGLAVFNFNQARMRARDVQRKSDLSQLQKALELYRNDNNGRYPQSIADQATVLVTAGYSKTVFVDPKAESWTNYVYTPTYTNGVVKGYSITACFENKADSTRTLPTRNCPDLAVGPGVIYTVTNP